MVKGYSTAPQGRSGGDRTGKTINQNLPNVQDKNKTMHELESQKGLMKVLNYFLTWPVCESSNLE